VIFHYSKVTIKLSHTIIVPFKIHIRLIILSVGDDVSINSDAFLVIDFVNLNIKSVQSFIKVECACVHKGECSYVYKDLCLYCVSKKIHTCISDIIR
jgi:hypothetical protein